ncbi:Uncharacterised protein [Yersinia frederiksenii]|uniref:Uncharacterized protein n=1 Tax=Yersinia frederiksenii TaxID=29484 RepID=A0AAI9EN87_YERFR|nr:Uncharacterised protein [Yersinia frederiksenii]
MGGLCHELSMSKLAFNLGDMTLEHAGSVK